MGRAASPNAVGPDYPREWGEWTDFIGNTYRAGDYVLYHSGGPLIGFGQVVKINRINSRKEPIMVNDDTGSKVPSCSVTIQPVEPSSKTHRWYRKDGGIKRVTITNPRNVVKVTTSFLDQFEEIKDSYQGTDSDQLELSINRIKQKYEGGEDGNEDRTGTEEGS